jgi:hypothetical protein
VGFSQRIIKCLKTKLQHGKVNAWCARRKSIIAIFVAQQDAKNKTLNNMSSCKKKFVDVHNIFHEIHVSDCWIMSSNSSLNLGKFK